jgi:hypothetical protein
MGVPGVLTKLSMAPLFLATCAQMFLYIISRFKHQLSLMGKPSFWCFCRWYHHLYVRQRLSTISGAAAGGDGQS